MENTQYYIIGAVLVFMGLFAMLMILIMLKNNAKMLTRNAIFFGYIKEIALLTLRTS